MSFCFLIQPRRNTRATCITGLRAITDMTPWTTNLQKPRTRKWWLWYGTLAWGIPFFVLMTAFGESCCSSSLLERRLNWRFYGDPRIHAAGLLVFSLAL